MMLRPIVLVPVLTLLSALLWSDDYQCVTDMPGGCTALMPGPAGTRVVKFKKGDIVSTASGWIVNPSDGWKQVDLILEVGERAGVLGPVRE